MFFTTVWAFLMPSVSNSIYFNNANSAPNDHRVNQLPLSTIKNSSIPQNSKTSDTIESHISKKEVILLSTIYNIIILII